MFLLLLVLRFLGLILDALVVVGGGVVDVVDDAFFIVDAFVVGGGVVLFSPSASYDMVYDFCLFFFCRLLRHLHVMSFCFSLSSCVSSASS